VGRPVKFQANNSNVSLVSAGTTAPARTLLSVPVLASSNSIADGTTGVDRSTILSVYGSVMLATKPGVLLRLRFDRVRATFRFGARIAAGRDALVKLTVATPGG
jgi:hypothetical protein